MTSRRFYWHGVAMGSGVMTLRFELVCCGCDTSYIVSVHIQCQASIYSLSLFLGHSWRVRLAKQETLTPPGHLVSPLVCRGPWMSTVVLYCWCHSDVASDLSYFTLCSERNVKPRRGLQIMSATSSLVVDSKLWSLGYDPLVPSGVTWYILFIQYVAYKLQQNTLLFCQIINSIKVLTLEVLTVVYPTKWNKKANHKPLYPFGWLVLFIHLI